MRRWTTWVALAVSCIGCRSDDVYVSVRVVVPAAIASVPSGVLRMSQWAYDPQLADAPALAAGETSLQFTHVQGRPDEFTMRVHGVVPHGARRYVTIRGYETTTGAERYILWDGLEGTQVPTLVEMRALS